MYNTLVVVTDRTFPRDANGIIDATSFAVYLLARGLTDAHVVLVADAYKRDRDDLLLATAHDFRWTIVYLNTTRSTDHEHERAFARWIGASGAKFDDVVFYGMGVWLG